MLEKNIQQGGNKGASTAVNIIRVAAEIKQKIKNKNKGYYMLGIDIKKAYDSVK